MDDELIVAHGGVELRELPQGLQGGHGDEGQVGQRVALVGLELRTPGAPHALDGLEVDLLDHERVRRRGLGADHVLGGQLANLGEGDDLVTLARSRGRGRPGGGLDVATGDASVGARSHHVLGAQALLGEEAADHGGELQGGRRADP